MRVVVTGGRRYGKRHRLFAELDAIHQKTPIALLAHGGATGADTLAEEWAKARGVAFRSQAEDMGIRVETITEEEV